MTGPPSRGAEQFRLPNVEQSYPALPYASRRKHVDHISPGWHVVVVKFQLNIHWVIPSVSQQLGYVAPVLLLTSVQLGVEELLVVGLVAVIVAVSVLVSSGGSEWSGRPAPGADRRSGARHRRKRRRAREVRMLILARVVMRARGEKCHFRHWGSCTSRRVS